MAGVGLYTPNSGPLVFPNSGPLIFPGQQAGSPGQLFVPQSLTPGVPRTNFQLGPTGPLQTPSVPNFRLGETGPLITQRGAIGAGPTGIWDVPQNLPPAVEATPRVTYANLRESMFGPRVTDHIGSSTWNSEMPNVAGTVRPNVASIPSGVAAPTELEMLALRNSGSSLPAWNPTVGGEGGFLQGLKSNALLRNTAPDAMAEGMGAAPALTGMNRAKSIGATAGKGLARGFGGMAIIGTANQLADALPANSAARPGIRSVGNVAGAGMMLPFIGGAQTAGAAPLGVGAAEIFSRSAAGNEVINAARNASTNPLANFAVILNPILGGEQAIRKLADIMGGGDGGIDLSNRTNDTVFDIFGGEGGGAQAVTPEQQQQRIAQTSPDALMKVTTDYGLDPAMAARLVENYRKSMVLAQAQGGIPLQVDKEGKLGDGTLAKDKAGVRAVRREDGTTSWMSSDPADIQEAVYTRSLQEIPLLAQQQSQEEDYMRKQALMQAQLEEAIPQYFGGASWAADPTAQMLAAASIRDIPSRYVQAQLMQTQQGINSQIEQAQIQQMLAQQYPELFGRQSSSQPATLDAAMAQ